MSPMPLANLQRSPQYSLVPVFWESNGMYSDDFGDTQYFRSSFWCSGEYYPIFEIHQWYWVHIQYF